MNVIPITGNMYEGCIFHGPSNEVVKLVRVTTNPDGAGYCGDFHCLKEADFDDFEHQKWLRAQRQLQIGPEDPRWHRKLLRAVALQSRRQSQEMQDENASHSLDWSPRRATRSRPVEVKWGQRLIDAEEDFIGRLCNMLEDGRDNRGTVRDDRHLPGSVSIHDRIVNIYIQSHEATDQRRSEQKREKLELQLTSCLQALTCAVHLPCSLALPHRPPVLFRSNTWPEYLAAIHSFAARNPMICIVLYNEGLDPDDEGSGADY